MLSKDNNKTFDRISHMSRAYAECMPNLLFSCNHLYNTRVLDDGTRHCAHDQHMRCI